MQINSNRRLGLSHSPFLSHHHHHLISRSARSAQHTTVASAAAASGPFFQRAQTNSSRYGARKPPSIDPLHTHDSQAAVGPALVNRGLSADPVQALVALLRSKAHAVDMSLAKHVDRSRLLCAGLLVLQCAQLLTVRATDSVLLIKWFNFTIPLPSSSLLYACMHSLFESLCHAGRFTTNI